jgi:hypothetical protein
MAATQKITSPAPKYGPTAEYGECEFAACTSDARATCATCDGQFCFGHAKHEAHTGDATTA